MLKSEDTMICDLFDQIKFFEYIKQMQFLNIPLEGSIPKPVDVVDPHILKRREYGRNYYHKNLDKVRNYQRNYYHQHRDQFRIYIKNYEDKHVEHLKEYRRVYAKKYRDEHPQIKLKKKLDYQNNINGTKDKQRVYYKNKVNDILEAKKNYYQANKETIKAKYRAKYIPVAVIKEITKRNLNAETNLKTCDNEKTNEHQQ